jgi:N-acyl homoserine lactone hydrolase
MKRQMKLTPLDVGTLKRDKTAFVMGSPPQPVDVPVIMFLVQATDANLLIDTGICDPNDTPLIHGLYEQTEAQKPERLLADLGLKADDIDIVINTHLRWDHCSNNRLFPKAKFYVQREELRYALVPLPTHAHGYESPVLGLTPTFWGTPFVLIEGDEEIADNVPFYENLREFNISSFKPSPMYVDLEDYYRSIRRVVDLGMPIIPGHDIAVIGKESLFG